MYMTRWVTVKTHDSLSQCVSLYTYESHVYETWWHSTYMYTYICNKVQHAATQSNPLQHTATHRSHMLSIYSYAICTRLNTCCNKVQHAATQSNPLQHTAPIRYAYIHMWYVKEWTQLYLWVNKLYTRTKQHAATRRNTLQQCKTPQHCPKHVHQKTNYNVLQHTATRCSVAICCSVLQCVT